MKTQRGSKLYPALKYIVSLGGKKNKSHKLSIILLLIKTHADCTQTNCSLEYEGHPLENKCGKREIKRYKRILFS